MKNRSIRILLTEDDQLLRMSLKVRLEFYGNVIEASTASEAMKLVEQYEFDMAFVDLDLETELAGLKVVEKLKRKNVYTVVLSGREDEEIISEAYTRGCRDYLAKPFSKSSIDSVIHKFQNTKQHFVAELKELLMTHEKSLTMQLDLIAEAIFGEHPILITGETGTGKTVLAKFIHQLIGQDKPFVHLNCSEISESLLESELFGHEKGSFTGALKTKKGLLELANGGILFLDEIATLPLQSQKKILKAIEEKSFYPVGSEKMKTSDFRLISATCENLKELVLEGRFRQDLYFRLEGFNISLKPLRERKEDLDNIINIFLKKNKRRIVLHPEVRKKFQTYSWPGNLRELEKTIEILRSRDKGLIELKDLNGLLGNSSENASSLIDLEKIKELGLNAYLEEVEAHILEKFLVQNNDKVRKTLADLKISNNTFYRIMTNLKSHSPTVHNEG